MLFIQEDSQQAQKKQIPIPQNAKQVFKAMEKMYEPYLDSNTDGAKIIKSLAADKHYNKKGTNSAKANGKELKQDSVSFNDAKTRLRRQEKFSPNSIQYQMYGGQLAHDILKKGVEGARNVQSVEAVKPPNPTSASNATKPSKPELKSTKTPNGTIQYTVTTENRQIKEDYDDYEDSSLYGAFQEYDVYYVLQKFLEDPKGHENWFPLIDPNMYKRALQEFTKYGNFVHFPTKYVYQWMGIILKNTALLNANNQLFGRGASMPLEEIGDFLDEWFKGERQWQWGHEDNLEYAISIDEFYELCNQKGIVLNEDYGLHKNGQYDLFMNQWETDAYDKKQAQIDANREKTQQFEALKPYINAYNKKGYYDKVFINLEEGALYRSIDIGNFLDEIGLYNWCSLPDNSVGATDYAMPKLEKILIQYNENCSPEQTLVLINKALDVYHQQGDISSMFIVGGSKTLSQISESIKHKKTIYLTENQILRLNPWLQ